MLKTSKLKASKIIAYPSIKLATPIKSEEGLSHAEGVEDAVEA